MQGIKNSFKLIRRQGGVEEYILKKNGLGVLLYGDLSSPLVGVDVHYQVGSRHEKAGETGATHILEHMLFKGSKNFNKANGRDFWNTIQDTGTELNATTWLDRTHYYEMGPKELLPLFLEMEADRMRGALIKSEDLTSEMTVVRNEYERGENDPAEALDKLVWATAFTAHGYHHSTIGWKHDIEGATAETLRSFYNTYYQPNNSVVTIAGNFETRDALRLIDKYFGKHKASNNLIPKTSRIEPVQEGLRRVELRRHGGEKILMLAFKIPGALHKDTPAISALTDILGGGKTSRLYKSLVDEGLASSIHKFHFPFYDEHIFSISVHFNPEQDEKEIEKILWQEIHRLKKGGVTAKELQMVKNYEAAQVSLGRDGLMKVMSHLTEVTAMGDWTLFDRFPKLIQGLSVERVSKMAGKYLLEEKATIGHFFPKNEDSGTGRDENISHANSPYYFSGPRHEIRQENISDRVMSLKDHGIKIFGVKTGKSDIVSIHGSFPGGGAHSNNPFVSSSAMRLLSEGSKKKDKTAIRSFIENRGAELNFFSYSTRSGFSLRARRQDALPMLHLLLELIKEATYPPKELNLYKNRILSYLKQSATETYNQADLAFRNYWYTHKHLNYEEPIKDSETHVKNLNGSEIDSFRKKSMGRGDLLLGVAGKVDHKFVKEIYEVFKALPKTKSQKILRSNGHKSKRGGSVNVYVPGKASSTILMGLPIPLKSTDPDYLSLRAGVAVLGGGFTSRFTQKIREKEGLTYGVYANLGHIGPVTEGEFQASGTYAPKLAGKGTKLMKELITEWVEKGITEKELRAKKKFLKGRFQVSLGTTKGFAGTLLSLLEEGHGPEYLDEYLRKVDVLKRSEVNKIIKKYINYKNIFSINAGTFKKEER